MNIDTILTLVVWLAVIGVFARNCRRVRRAGRGAR